MGRKSRAKRERKKTTPTSDAPSDQDMVVEKARQCGFTNATLRSFQEHAAPWFDWDGFNRALREAEANEPDDEEGGDDAT